jgi:hypothetical protein
MSRGEDEEGIDSETDADSGRECLSLDELREALGSLTTVDLKRLNRASEMLARDLPITGEELVGDAVHAAFVGRRRCPRDVPVMVFLKNAIRSLASSAKNASARSNIVLFPGGTQENPNLIERAPDASANPEQVLLQRCEEGDAQKTETAARLAVQKLNEHFSKDYEVQLCIAGMMDGLAGQELKDLVGVDQAGIDYARKKIYRAVGKLFPRGWRNVQK